MDPLPNIDDCSDFTESQVFEYISKVIERLHQSEESADICSGSDLIFRISNSYFDFDDYLDLICDKYINENIIKPINYFLRSLSDYQTINDESLYLIYVLLINFSDYSSDFARALYSSDIFPFLIDNCLSDRNVSNISDNSTNVLLQNCLKIINNIVRDAGNTITHRLAELKIGLQNFFRLNDSDLLGVLSMLTLSYIIEENECHLLDEGVNVINILLQKIRYVIESGNRSGGFSIAELMHGIRCISANDKMKRKIHECKGIPIFLDILQRNNEAAEIEPTLGTIWNLCFIRELKVELIIDYRIENVIEQFANHSNEKIRRNYDGILWEIKTRTNRKPKQLPLSENNTSGFDVFISYAWPNKPQIMEIRKSLSLDNIRVWVDDEQMRGSTLEAMASGIENSHVFVIGISSSYMKSPNCRTEAEYAFQMRKPIIPLIMELKFKPHNWLGIIVGTKVYYEFSERRKPEEEVVKLKKSIRNHLNGGEVAMTTAGCTSSRPAAVGGDGYNQQMSDVIKDWSCEKVGEWLQRWGLAHVKERLMEVDGALLTVLLEVRLKSPEYFNKTMKTEFGMEFVDVLRFHRALNELDSI